MSRQVPFRVARGVVRRSPAVALLLAMMLLAACATKRDMKLLRDEIVQMDARQDSMLRAMQRQNQLLLDTLRSSFNLQQNVRGDLSHQIGQLLQRLMTVEELLGQQQQQMAEFRRGTGQPVGGGIGTLSTATGPPDGGVPGGDVETLYELGLQKAGEGSYASARIAFEELLRSHGTSPRAPDAQFQLAETYHLEGDHERALTELERVPQQWPASSRAPQALFRAGVIAQERNDITRARRYYTQVVQAYRNSDERRQAEARLRTLPQR